MDPAGPTQAMSAISPSCATAAEEATSAVAKSAMIAIGFTMAS
jgi:hypothetical protein